MGDRAQVAIKKGADKVYLYGHWIGSDIYPAIGRALKRAPARHRDSEYLARIVLDEMKGNDREETGFGIGVAKHGDIEHAIPVLDCASEKVSFEPGSYSPKTPASEYTFDEFSKRALAGDFSEF